MTLNEITTLIASHLEMELDDPFKLMMAKRVGYWRSRLIKNSVDKDQKDRRFFKQVIYVKMEVQNEIVCNVPYTQCKIAKSVGKVPKPTRANGVLFDYVGAIDGMNAFTEGSGGMIPYMMQGKYSKNVIRYTYENEYIKIYGNVNIPMIRVDGVFDDPEAAAKMNCNNGQSNDCDFWNIEYPVTGDILQLIVQSILQVDYNRAPNTETKQIPVTAEK
jgi:hypothetical protein